MCFDSTILRAKLKGRFLNPTQDGGGGAKRPPTSFPPVASTDVGISPQNFLTFSFNSFDRLV